MNEMFDRKYMQKLYDLGYQMAATGYPWHKAPPGFESPWVWCFKTTRWIKNPFTKGAKFDLSTHFQREAAAFGMDWRR